MTKHLITHMNVSDTLCYLPRLLVSVGKPLPRTKASDLRLAPLDGTNNTTSYLEKKKLSLEADGAAVDAEDIEIEESVMEEVLDLNAKRKAFDPELQCVVDTQFVGDEELMQRESEKVENLQNVGTFLVIMALATFATAVCCYLVFNFEAHLALAIFLMTFVSVTFDLLLFRNLIVFIITLCKYRRGKRHGYEYIAVEFAKKIAEPTEELEAKQENLHKDEELPALAGRLNVADKTNLLEQSESESKHGSQTNLLPHNDKYQPSEMQAKLFAGHIEGDEAPRRRETAYSPRDQ